MKNEWVLQIYEKWESVIDEKVTKVPANLVTEEKYLVFHSFFLLTFSSLASSNHDWKAIRSRVMLNASVHSRLLKLSSIGPGWNSDGRQIGNLKYCWHGLVPRWCLEASGQCQNQTFKSNCTSWWSHLSTSCLKVHIQNQLGQKLDYVEGIEQAHRRDLFYPIWAYWACFAPGSKARCPIVIDLITHIKRCTSLRDPTKDTRLVKKSKKS